MMIIKKNKLEFYFSLFCVHCIIIFLRIFQYIVIFLFNKIIFIDSRFPNLCLTLFCASPLLLPWTWARNKFLILTIREILIICIIRRKICTQCIVNMEVKFFLTKCHKFFEWWKISFQLMVYFRLSLKTVFIKNSSIYL